MQDIISVEKVLNSRCSCDFDDNPKNNHWGMFIKDKHPSQETIQHMLQRCRVPQFSSGKLSLWFEGEHLFLGFEKTNDPFNTRLLHVESGMQQEAVYLACTALGLGTCINNLGIDGTAYGDKIATARHLILEKEASYATGKFSTAAPGPEKPFKKGKNISEPGRDGHLECLKAMEQLTLSEGTGIHAGEIEISQLLWAAKGRTPHYVKSHPWGLTIPTWGGGQNYTNVYLAKDNKLYRYINWTIFRYINWKTKSFPWWIAGNPTHDIKFVGNINVSFELDNTNVGIILSRNEKTNRALWEVGYMLENMLLQAKSLGISYKTKIFKDDETERFERNGISGAVAALVL
jgi:hypothetical protein